MSTNSTKATAMNFSEALIHLKSGRRITRAGWNGKNMFLFHIERNSWYYDSNIQLQASLPFIALRTGQDEVVPWLASQTDILSEDWETIP